MKYQNLKSFHKHLASAAPHHLCRVYLIAMPDDFERSRALESVLRYLKTPASRFNGTHVVLRDLLDAMQSYSLFGSDPVIVVDEVDKLGKKDLQVLADHLSAVSSYVLLGTRSKTVLAGVVEKEGIVLDLLDEKPWDKEKRLADQLIEKVKGVGKKLALEGASLLIERLGTDGALLESEIDKLICYVGERPQIGREDILSISPESRTSTLWQAAEEVIWEGGGFPAIDSSAFHSLLPALRHQLELGLTLATLIEERRPADEWGRFLPRLWPKMLEKRSAQAARLGPSFFRNGLERLFAIELASRTHSTQYRALLDLFRAQMYAR